MIAKKKWFWYPSFVLVLTVCFLYALFPADKFKQYLLYQLNKTYPQINIAVDRIVPAFPPGLKLYDIDVKQMGDTLLKLEKMKIRPDLLSLFRASSIFFFKINTCDGMIDGRGELARKNAMKKVYIDAAFKGIKIAKIGAVQSLKREKISGVLEGHLNYSYDMGSDENLQASFIIADGEIELINPLLMLDSISFSVIESSLLMKNREISFKQCSLKGPQMDGNLAGSIVLAKPWQKSVLKLVGAVRPHPTLLAELEKNLPADQISQKFFSKSGLSIRLNGTIGKPIFSIN
jgi:type II secretion system protein N